MKAANPKLLLFLLLAASVLPFIWIAFFCHPSADDFAYSWSTKQIGIIASCQRDYFNWNGRYFSNLLVFLNPISYNLFLLYKLIPLILLVLTFISIWFFCNEVFSFRVSKVSVISSSLLLLLLYLVLMPQLAQGIYWYTGAVTYQGACILMLFYFTHLIRFKGEKYFFNFYIDFLLLLVQLFCIVGFNETAMLQMLFFHSLLLFKLPHNWFWLLGLSLLFFSFFVVFSPGNTVRSANFPNKHQLFYSLEYSVLQTLRFLMAWLGSFPLIIASLLSFSIAPQFIIKYPEFLNALKIKPLNCFMLLFLLLFISVFPAYWSTGILGQHRTLNAACFFFIIAWFLLLFSWIKNNLQHPILIRLINFSAKNKNWLIVFFFLSILLQGNLKSVCRELLSGAASNYNKEMDARYQQVDACRKNFADVCVLDSLSNKPCSIYSFDISADENYWINKGEAAFFGINKIKIRDYK